MEQLEDTSLESPATAVLTDGRYSSTPATGVNSYTRTRARLFGFNAKALILTAVAVIVMILIGVSSLFFSSQTGTPKQSKTGQTADSYAVSSLSADGIKPSNAQLSVGQADHLSVNGQLRVNDTLVLAPSAQPTTPTAGQIYYDKASNQPYYFNGSSFISLAPVAVPQHLTSLGGASGIVTLGTGLQILGNQLTIASSLLQSVSALGAGQGSASASIGGLGSNLSAVSARLDASINAPRVSSLQGLSGDVSLVAGTGISISGTTISSTGVTDLTSTSAGVTIQRNANGSYSIDIAGSGAAPILLAPSVVQSDGTNNTIIAVNKTAGSGDFLDFALNGVSKFVVDQNGNITAGAIACTHVQSALCAGDAVTSIGGVADNILVGNGLAITGHTLSNNGVVSVNGTANQISVTPGANGLVTLSLSQDIATTSAPTFAGATLNGATAITGQVTVTGGVDVSGATTTDALTVQGGNLTLGTSGSRDGLLRLNNAISLTNAVVFQGLNPTGTGDATIQIPSIAGGTVDQICLLSLGNCAGAGSGVTSTTGLAGYVPVFDASQNITNSILFQQGSGVGINTTSPGAYALNVQGGDVNFAGTTTVGNGLNVSAGASSFAADVSVTGASTFTVGTGTTTLGGAATIAGLATLNGGLAVTGSTNLSGAVTVTGANTLTVGTGTTTLGGALGVTGAANLQSSLAVTGTTTLTGSLTANGGITSNGNITQTGAGSLTTGTGAVSLNGNTAVTGSSTFGTGTGAVSLNGDTTVTGTKNFTVNAGDTSLGGNLQVAGATTFVGTATVQSAGGLNLGVAGTTDGILNFANTNNNQYVSLQGLAPTGVGTATIQLPSIAGGTSDQVCLLTLANCVGAGGGVTSTTGSANYVARFTSASVLGIGALYDTGTAVGINTTSPGAYALNVQGGNVNFSGTATIGTGLNVTGATTLAGNVSVTGSSSFTVGTGAVTLGGALSVAGASTLSGTLAVNAASNFNAAVAITGSNTLSVGGATTLNSGLDVAGAATFTSSIAQTGAGTLSTGTGAVSLNGNVSIAAGKSFMQNGSGSFDTGTGPVNLNGTTAVTGTNSFTVGTGPSTFNGTVSVAGQTTLTGGADITGTTNINTTGAANTSIGNNTGTFSLNSSTTKITTGGAISGVSTISASGAISGATSGNTINGLVVNAGSLSSVTGIATNGGYTQTGSGANTLSGATSFTASGTALSVANNATIGGTATIGTLSVGNGGIASSGTLTVSSTSSSSIAGQLNLTGSGTGLSVTNSTTIGGDLTVHGSNGVVIGTSGSVPGVLSFANTVNSNLASLQAAAPSGTGTANYVLPSITGGSSDTVCLVTLNNCGGSPNTVIASTTGTANSLAKFTAGNSIADSSITDDGTTVTVNANLLALNISTSLIQSSAAMSITPGGNLTIGATNHDLALQGNGSSSFSVSANGFVSHFGFTTPTANRTINLPDESGTVCLQNSNNCGFAMAASGVTSVNSLAGNLTVANASASGSTITLDDASTSQKGIAQFNASDFSSSGGVIDTVQGITTTSAVQFGSLTLGTGDLTLSATSAVNTNIIKNVGSNDITIDATANAIIFKTASGTNSFMFPTYGGLGQVICTSGISCATGGGQALILEPSSVQAASANRNAIFVNKASGTGNLMQLQAGGTDALVIDNLGNTSIYGSTTISTLSVPGTLTTNTITSTGSLTVGSTGQAFTLQGTGASVISATASGVTTSVGFNVGSGGTAPTGNVTYQFQNDNGVAPGTYNVCTTAGNCAGVGGSVTTSGGTAGKLSKFTASGNIADSLASESGSTISIAGNLAIGASGSSQLTLGVASTASGTIVFNNATNGNTITVDQAGAPAANRIVKLPTQSGTIAVSATGPIQLDPLTGQISCATCLTGGGGAGSGVSSLDTLTGNVTIANTTAAGSVVTIDNASTTVKGIAQFNATNFTASSGTINTIQDIATGSSVTFGNLTLQGTNGLTIGSSNNIGQLAFKDGTADGYNAAFSPATLTANRSIVVPNASGTLAVSASGNLSLSALGDLSITNSPTFTGSVTTPSILSSGSLSITPTGQLTLGSTGQQLRLLGNGSTTLAATASGNTTTVGFVSPTGTRTISFPDASGTLCLQSSASCGFALSTAVVSSLNGLTGGLTVANATTGGSTITINDASTSQKGIAQFNATNFTASSGTINTIQDISSSSSPTFAGLTVNAGGATINGAVTLNGNTIISGTNTLSVGTGAATFGGTVGIAGLTTITGGVTITGTASINTTGTASTAIGNATGTFSVTSPGLNISTTGAVSGATTIAASGAISAATSGNTINGIVVNAGAVSNVTGYNQGSGNFGISGSGTFSTGSGAVSLNGDTSITGSKTLTVGTGATTLGGTLTVAGAGSFTTTLAVGSSSQFQVTSSGNVTSGTINGQTISSAANFTGSVTVQGTAGLSLGVPGSVDGNLTLANSTSARTVSLQGLNPTGTGNAIVRIPSIAGGSTDQVCLLTLANCVGVNGAIAGSGTQNYLSKFDTAGGNHIGSTQIYDDGTFVGVNTTTNNAKLSVVTSGTQSSVYIQGAATGTAAVGVIKSGGSTGDLLQLQNSSGVPIAKIDSTGKLFATSFDTVSAGTLNIGTTNATSIGLKQNTTVTGTFAAGSASQFQVSGAGAVTAVGVNSSSGVIQGAGGLSVGGAVTLSSLNTSGVVHTDVSGNLSTSAVLLGTDTSGSYVSALGALTGLSATGNSGAGSTPTLSVIYGSGANQSAQGNTALSFTGSGNLTGTVSGTAGGGITTNTLALVSSPTLAGTLTVQGATVSVGTPGSLAGGLVLANASNTHTTTLQGLAAAGQDQVITLPASTATTDQVCLLTLANCVGVNGAVSTTSGTQYYITKYNNVGASQITNSQLYDTGTFVGLNTTTNNGQLSVQAAGTQSGLYVQGAATGSSPTAVLKNTGSTGDFLDLKNSIGTTVASIDSATNLSIAGQYRINGTQISSANLSNDSNLAKLNATQTFTGNNTFSGTGTSLAVTNNATVGGTLAVTGRAAFGGSSAIDGGFADSRNTIDAEDSYTNLLGINNINGLNSAIQVNATANNATSVSGVSAGVSLDGTHNYTGQITGSSVFALQNGSGNVTKMYGSIGTAESLGAGTIAELGGGQLNGANVGGGTVTEGIGSASSYLNLIGTTTTAIGAQNEFDNYAGTTTTGTGTLSVIKASGGSITSARGAYAQIQNNGAGTITNGYGLYLDSAVNNGGGTFTNNYGLYIQDQSAVGSTNSYNIYSAGATAKNYLQGTLTVGGASTFNNTAYINTNNAAAFKVEQNGVNNNTLLVDTNAGRVSVAGTGQAGYALTVNGSSYTTGAAVINTNSSNALQVANNTNGQQILNVNTVSSALLTNPDFESTTTGWGNKSSATLTRITTPTSAIYNGKGSGQIVTTAAANVGAFATYAFSPSTQYTLSFYARASGANFSTLNFGRQDVSGTDIDCATAQTVVTTGWARYSCTFTTGATITSSNIYVKQSDATIRTFYIDAFQLEQGASVTPYTQGVISARGTFDAATVFQNASDSTTAFQIQNAAGTSNLLVADTVNSNLLLNANVGIGGGIIAGNKLTVTGNSQFAGNIILSGNNSLQINTGSAGAGGITRNNTTSSAVSQSDVVDMDAGVFTVSPSATDRSPRVYGVATAAAGSGVFTNFAVSGNTVVNADTNAINIGDQLVTTTTAGKVKADNNATTGIVGYATTAKAGGSTGTVSVRLAISGGQTTPNFRSDGLTAFQIQNAAGNNNLFVADTTNGKIGIGMTPSSSGAALQVTGNISSTTSIIGNALSAATTISANSGYIINTASQSAGYIQHGVTLGAGGATINDVLVLDSSAQGVDTTMPRDPRVYGVAAASGSAAANILVTTGGNTIVNADATSVAINIGDQLVTSASSGRVVADNAATTGILGYATSALASGTGTVGVRIQVHGGQYSPTFRNAADSNTAFNVQNAAGTNLLSVDTTNSRVNFGTGGRIVAGTTGFTAQSTSATGFIMNQASSFSFQDSNNSYADEFKIQSGGQAAFKNAINSTAAFQIQNAAGENLINVDTTNTTNLVTNGGFEANTTSYTARTGTTLTRATTGQYDGVGMGVLTNTATAGAGINYPYALSANTSYSLSFYVNANATMATLVAGRADDGSTETDCSLSLTSVTISWQRATCSFTTGASITGSPYFYIKQSDATGRTINIDDVMLQTGLSVSPYGTGKIAFNGVISSPVAIQSPTQSSTALQVLNSANQAAFNVSTISGNVSSLGTIIARDNYSGMVQLGSSATTPQITFGYSTGPKITASNTSNNAAGLIIASTSSADAALRVVGYSAGTANAFEVASGYAGQATLFSVNDATGAALHKQRTDTTAAFQIQNAAGENLINVDTATTSNLITNGGFEVNTTGYSARTGTTLSRLTAAPYDGAGYASLVTTATAGAGVNYAYPLASSTTYTLSFEASASIVNNMQVGRADDGSTETTCTLNSSALLTTWGRYSCTFTTGTTSGSPYIFIRQQQATAKTIYLDDVQLELGSAASAYGNARVALNGVVTSRLSLQNTVDSANAFQVLSTNGTSVLSVDTATNVINGTYLNVINLGAAGSLSSNYLNLGGNSTGNVNYTTNSASGGGVTRSVTLASGSVAQYDVVSLSAGAYSVAQTTTARDQRVFGIANAAGSSPSAIPVFVSGQTTVNVDTGAVNVGDQLVSSSTAGQATVDNNATYGIVGYATTAKIAGSAGTVGVRVSITTGQSTPRFQNASNSITAFQIQNAAGTSNLFNADTSNTRIGIGTNAPAYTLDVAGDINTTGVFRVNGTQISSTDLSNDSNLAKLNGSQTFTGTNTFNNAVSVTGTTNINTSGSSAVNIGTGTYTGAITIGNTATAANAVTINAGSTGQVTLYGGATSLQVGNTIVGTSATLLQFNSGATIKSLSNGSGSTGAMVLSSGISGGTASTSGTVTLQSGNGTGTNTSSGNVNLEVGTATGTAGAINIGVTNASAVNISRTGVLTSVLGNESVAGTLSVTGSTATAGLTNSGSTINTVSALGDLASGPLGTAAATVDTHTSFTISPTASGRTYSIPAPTAGAGAAGQIIYISNINGTNSFTIGSVVFSTGSTAQYIWNGSAWSFGSIDTGVTTVGGIDGGTYSANGASILGNTIYLQTASGSQVGLVSTSAQVFAGDKTFKSGSNSSTAFSVQNSSSVNLLNANTVNLSLTAGSSVSGQLAPWATNANTLPAARAFHTSIVANGYVYAIGGYDSTSRTTVYYAKLNADGSTGTWTTNANALPAIRSGHASVAANGYAYVIGGSNDTTSQSTVYYAKLNADGSTGTWTTNANALPAIRQSASSVVSNGYVYLLGGTDATTSQSTVYYAKLNADGSTGTWTTNANALPAARTFPSVVLANGYVYAIGGLNSSDVAQSSVYYASTQRLQVNASLDLVGVSNGSIADADSAGGELTAGNTNIIGALQVQGTANFSKAVNVVGTLTVSDQVFLKNTANSTSAFQIQNAAGTSIFNVDTTNAKIGTINTSVASTNSAVLTIKSGDASGATSNSGNVVLDSGTATGTAGNITIGTGAYAHNTTIGNITGSSALTLQAGTGNVNVAAGSSFVNNSATLNTASALGDLAAGALGASSATVDVFTTFTISPTASGRTYTIPSPTTATAGRIIYIANINGTNSFTIGSVVFSPGSTAQYIWNGSAWSFGSIDTGVTTVGAFNTFTAAANGATISGNTIYLQSATTTVPGLVDTTTQSFLGAKTFNTSVQVGTGSGANAGSLTVNGDGQGGKLLSVVAPNSGTAGSVFKIGNGTTDYFTVNQYGATTIQAPNSANSTTFLQVKNSPASGGTVIWNLDAQHATASVGKAAVGGTYTLDVGSTGSTGSANFDSFVNVASGGITVAGASSIAGGTVSLNNNSNNITNINTGSSTGAVNIGSSTAGNITLQSAGTGTIAIGNSTSGNINIQAAAGNNVTIGNASSSGTINIGVSGTNNAGINIGTGSGSTPINIGTGNATGAIAIGTGLVNTSLTIGGTGQTGALTLGQSTATNAINIGNATIATGNTGAISIGTSAAGTGRTQINIGSTNASSYTAIQGGTGTVGAISLQTGDTSSILIGTNGATGTTVQIGNTSGVVSQTINIGNNTTGSSNNTVLIGSTQDGSTTTIQSGTGNININPSGASNTGVIVKPGTDSTAAFKIQNAGGTSLFSADTTNSRVTVRSANDAATLGSELANSTFNTTWTGTGWTLTGTNATHNTGNTNTLSPTTPITITAGATYRLAFTVSGRTAGSVQAQVGGAYINSAYAANATETEVITATTTGNLIFTPTSTFDGVISAVSLKLITPASTSLAVLDSTGTTTLEVRGASSSSGSTFVGLGSGQSNSASGLNNTGFGTYALQSNITGIGNSAFGNSALQYNSTGTGNSAFGASSLISNTTGSNNTAYGSLALSANINGTYNVGLGASSLSGNLTGSRNIGIGASALASNTTGSFNTGLGDATNVLNANLSYGTAIGAGATVGSSNTIVLGRAGATDGVSIGTSYGQLGSKLNVGSQTYSTGTITQSGSTVVSGSGTAFTKAMTGGTIHYSDGTSDSISFVSSGTLLLTANSKTVTAGSAYTIAYGGFAVSTTATVMLQNTTDSSSAFQVQNTAGSSIFNVDTSTASISLATAQNPKIQAWSNGLNNPVFLERTALVTARGYAFMIGGDDSSNSLTSVYSSEITTNNFSGWTATTSLPAGRYDHGAVYANGYIYVVGGSSGSVTPPATATSTVYYAHVNNDGTLGSWNTTTALPAGVGGAATVTNNGYLYVMGGYSSISGGGVLTRVATVYSAKLNADGTVGAWVTSGTPMTSSRAYMSASVANDYIYLAGGLEGAAVTTVQTSKLNSDGTNGSWTTTNNLGTAVYNATSVVLNGYLYILGGYTGSAAVATVQYGALAGSTVSGLSVNNTTTAIPAASMNSAAIVYNGRIFFTSGGTGPGITSPNSYVATIGRVSVNTSLDLVGSTSSSSTGSGSSGGELTAGSTNILGTLQVQNSASFGRSVSVQGTLSVFDQVAFQSAANSTNAFQVQNSAGTSVLNIDTTSNKLTVRSASSAATLGSELANNTFNTTWTGTGWTLGASSATHTSGVNTLSPTTPITVTAGSAYQVNYTISGMTTGSVTASIGGVSGTTYLDDETVSEVLVASGTGNLAFTPTASFDGTISAVSVKVLSRTSSTLTLADASGTSALEMRVTTASSANTFIGISSGQSNTTGTNNAALGSQTLQSNTTGTNNAALGSRALQKNTTGTDNTATGYNALTANTIGIDNSAFGSGTLQYNSSGGNNTAVGYQALQFNSTGWNNVAVGYQALQANLWGTNNIAIGSDADVLSAGLSQAAAIGYGAAVGSSDTISLGRAGTVDSVLIGSSYSTGKKLSVSANTYNSGTIAQSGTAITGAGTTFTSGMNGGTIYYSDGTSATVTYVSATSLTSSVSKTVTAGSSYSLIWGGFGVSTLAAVILQNTTDSTNAFKIQDASGSTIFSADTTNGRIYVGNSTADSTGVSLVLDTKNTSGDPTGVDGAMYYNSSSKSFRCYSNSAWRSCMAGVVAANTSTTGNTVTNTTTDTAFATNYSIPANDCQPGRVYKVTVRGVYGLNGGGTLTLSAKMGSTAIGQTPAMSGTVTNNSWWSADYTIICQTTGSTGTVEGQGWALMFASTSDASGTGYAMRNTSAVTIDTTTAQTLQFSAKWGTASASNTITARQVIIEASGP